GAAVFLSLMSVMFYAIFALADKYFMEPINDAVAWLGEAVRQLLPAGVLSDLLVDGVIAGVGGVVVFLPQIMILFGFLAVLEDCGYMARAAFLMDKIMAKCGLSGKSFIPMLSSFACAIPGVMATRTIEDRRDRLATILVAPLMSCSARIPVYVLLISAFVPPVYYLGFVPLQQLVMLAMYIIGLVVAPLVAWTLKRTVLKGEPPVFLMELPSYKFPSPLAVLHRMADRGWAFVRRAGTLILATTVVVWALQYYPRPAAVAAPFDAKIAVVDEQLAVLPKNDDRRKTLEAEKTQCENDKAAAYQEQSYLGRVGKSIEPIVRPLGWDWRIGMAAVASFPAREVVVATLGTIFAAGSDEDALPDRLHAATWPDGRPLFTLPVALSVMVFFALCAQCAATLVVIRRETGSWSWPVFTFVYMTTLAYAAAFATYQGTAALGW
ncbi:MAG: ferrous iron transporter B, partial [Planctomycetia bacterium]